LSVNEDLNAALLLVLEETFESVQGIYLDRGTSVFETLSTISAEEASRPTARTCASLAAHVEHMAFYIETILKFIRGEQPEADWNEIWGRVEAVTPKEWEASQHRLKAALGQVKSLIENTDEWRSSDEIAGAIGLVAHNAYHLGEIRQALCALRPDR